MNGVVTVLRTIGLLALSLVRGIGRLLARSILLPVRPLASHVDSSPRVGRVINAMSALMAAQRGLLLLVGVGLTIVSMIITPFIIVAVASSAKTDNIYLLCLPLALLHMGVLMGFAGVMLVIPLGQGYKGQ